MLQCRAYCIFTTYRKEGIFLAILTIFFGVAVAFQSAVNARLRSFVQSPLLTSLISFSIGTIALFSLTFMRGEGALLSFEALISLPFWTYAGGLLGLIYLTINIVLFKKIGGVQTAVLPIFGQLVMGALIDQFGLIYAPVNEMTLTKAFGLLLVVAGVVVVTDLIFVAVKAKSDAPFIWKAIGVGAGMLSAVQAAVNGHLGNSLGSPVVAATISFIVGTILLLVLVLATKTSFSNVKLAVQAGTRYWWIWLGGLLGAFYVFGMAFAVPKIGAGQVIVFAIFGQLLSSALIDHFGLLGAMKKPLQWQKVAALVVMLVGVLFVKL